MILGLNYDKKEVSNFDNSLKEEKTDVQELISEEFNRKSILEKWGQKLKEFLDNA